jgi:GTP pyrophosphokinase
MSWEEFKNKIISYINFREEELLLIKKAFDFAQKAHEGQKRKNGEPYFNHSLRTALNLAEIKSGPEVVAAGILHDVLEDCNVSEEEMKREFGEEITELVKGVTKIGHYKYYETEEEQAKNLLNLILKISEDLRIAIIKIADRLDNMRTLEYLPEEKIKRIALETRDIFVPLATRLGIYVWASELDELCFKFLEPEKYEWVKKIKVKVIYQRL